MSFLLCLMLHWKLSWWKNIQHWSNSYLYYLNLHVVKSSRLEIILISLVSLILLCVTLSGLGKYAKQPVIAALNSNCFNLDENWISCYSINLWQFGISVNWTSRHTLDVAVLALWNHTSPYFMKKYYIPCFYFWWFYFPSLKSI